MPILALVHFNLSLNALKSITLAAYYSGFGSLFFGLEFMGDAVKPLAFARWICQ